MAGGENPSGVPPSPGEGFYDVVVIGAGLAGCAAAILLAQAGVRVLLLEAGSLPQDKLCGEFLSPECQPIFHRLGVWPTIQAHHPSAITATRLTAPNGQRWDTPLPAPALGLSRYALDLLLFERAAQAGATTLTNARVTGIERQPDGQFLVTWRHAHLATHQTLAALVLGAWGKRATLDRTLNRPFLAQSHPTFALKAHYSGPPLERRVELHGFDGGYCGLAEVEGGHINLCLLADTRLLRQHGDPDRFVQAVLPTNPALGAWLAQASRVSDRFIAVSQIPFVPKRQGVDGVLMLGDAAGLISPLAGNGMAMALSSAEIAAPLALQYLSHRINHPTLIATYTQRWQARFRTRLWLGRIVQPLLFRPAALSLSLHLLRLIPPLGQAVVAHTRDPRPHQDKTIDLRLS